VQTVSDRWSSKELRSPRSRNYVAVQLRLPMRTVRLCIGLPALHPNVQPLFSSSPHSLLFGSGQSLLPSLRRETRKPYNRSTLLFLLYQLRAVLRKKVLLRQREAVVRTEALGQTKAVGLTKSSTTTEKSSTTSERRRAQALTCAYAYARAHAFAITRATRCSRRTVAPAESPSAGHIRRTMTIAFATSGPPGVAVRAPRPSGTQR
jgi:hypothetical protein